MHRDDHQKLSRTDHWGKHRQRMKERIATSRNVPVQVIMQVLEVPEGIECWLMAKPPEAVVGDRYTPDDVVLANYLWETLRVYVDVFDFIVYNEESIPTPSWCRAFNKEEDDTRGDGVANEVTATEALDILHRALKRS